MRSGDRPFAFEPNFNFGTDNLMVAKNSEQSASFPPVSGDFDLLDGTDFLLLDGSKFLLL